MSAQLIAIPSVVALLDNPVLQAIRAAVWVKSPDGRYLEANPECDRLWGRSVVGLTAEDIFSPRDARLMREADGAAMRCGFDQREHNVHGHVAIVQRFVVSGLIVGVYIRPVPDPDSAESTTV